MSEIRTFTIANSDDLQTLANTNRSTINNIKMTLPIKNQITIEKKINKLYFACGCKSGAAFLIFSILFCTIDSTYLHIINSYIIKFILIVAVTLIGKFSGKIISNMQLTYLMIKIKHELQNQSLQMNN